MNLDLTRAKLEAMADEDGISEAELLKFAKGVYEAVKEHSPDGCFQVILPKTGYYHPLRVRSEMLLWNDYVGLLYQLRECVPRKRSVIMIATDGTRQQELTVRMRG